MTKLSLRLIAAALAVATLVLGSAAPAQAGHLKGGHAYTHIDEGGKLKGTATVLYAGGYFDCAAISGQPSPWPIGSLLVTAPGGQTYSLNVGSGTVTHCQADYFRVDTSFDLDLAAAFGANAADGFYEVRYNSSCRAGGIVNMDAADPHYCTMQFRAAVRKVSGQHHYSPDLTSSVALGIAKGYGYSQNLNVVDRDGGALTYTSLAGRTAPPDYGPKTDVVSISSTGQVAIPAATTATFTNGQLFVYKVRVTDAQGDYAERDVLLRVTDNNAPPQLAGLADSYDVAAGAERTASFSAGDPNNSAPKVDSVSLGTSGAPSWVTLTQTAGNPASGTLRIAPGANVAPGTYTFNIEALDDDPASPLTDSRQVSVTVAEPDTTPPPVPTIASTAPATRTATFEFTSESGATFECRIDGGAWQPCASGIDLTASLDDGHHTFDVRAMDAAGNRSEPATRTFILDRAVESPALLAEPAATTAAQAATFEFTGEPGASFDCSLDDADLAPCTSPVTYDVGLGDHSFRVRQTDAAGNVSAVRTVTWKRINEEQPKPAEEPPRPVAEQPARPVAEEPRSVTEVVSSTVAINPRDHSVKIGCKIAAGALRTCAVEAYVMRRMRAGAASAAAARRILVGRGAITISDTNTRQATVRLRLNNGGRRLLQRSLGGLPVVLDMKATTIKGSVLQTTERSRFFPRQTRVVPRHGLFATRSAKLSPATRRYLAGLYRQLTSVDRVTCAGHTADGFNGAANYRANHALGKRRADAACEYLRRLGLNAARTAVSYGETRPRFTNTTADGRKRNRRVELTFHYRDR